MYHIRKYGAIDLIRKTAPSCHPFMPPMPTSRKTMLPAILAVLFGRLDHDRAANRSYKFIPVRLPVCPFVTFF